jgi:hypothetical protein
MVEFVLTIEIGSWWLGISSNLLTKKTPTIKTIPFSYTFYRVLHDMMGPAAIEIKRQLSKQLLQYGLLHPLTRP